MLEQHAQRNTQHALIQCMRIKVESLALQLFILKKSVFLLFLTLMNFIYFICVMLLTALLCVCVCKHTACSHIAQWTLESLSSWRSCWPGNSWSTPLKRRLPSRPYACGSRNASNASGRLVTTQTRTLLLPFSSVHRHTVHRHTHIHTLTASCLRALIETASVV